MTEQYRPTRLEIDLSALEENARRLRAKTPKTALLMAVVKADAYGHGAAQAARAAIRGGADWLAVAIPEEGVALREAGLDAPLLVLGGIAKEGAEAAAAYGLSQAVFDAETVRYLDEAAARRGTTLGLHVKVDSGMGRIGVRDEAALNRLVAAIDAAKHVRLEGVFTHFATSDDEDLSFAREQARRFEAITATTRASHPDAIVHACNSAALLRCPEYAYGMVRAGIALYCDPNLPGGEGAGLREAMRWTTRAVYVKEVEPGESVSYGRRFVAERPTRVMTLPLGYADGYRRCLGGTASALVRGRRAPVIGRVCMDQIMLDVTDVPDAAVGDEVVLLGAQGNERISAREFAGWLGTIEYEVFLSPTARVPKVYTA